MSRLVQQTRGKTKKPCKRCSGTGKEPKTGGVQGGYFGMPAIRILPSSCTLCKGRKTQR